MTTGQAAYQEYLQTDKWKTIRAQRLAMDNSECVLCGNEAKHVHHRRYPKEWGTETVNDLVCLCQDCHSKHHGADDGFIYSQSRQIRIDPEKDTVDIHIKENEPHFFNVWELDSIGKILDVIRPELTDFIENVMYMPVGKLCQRVTALENKGCNHV